MFKNQKASILYKLQNQMDDYYLQIRPLNGLEMSEAYLYVYIKCTLTVGTSVVRTL